MNRVNQYFILVLVLAATGGFVSPLPLEAAVTNSNEVHDEIAISAKGGVLLLAVNDEGISIRQACADKPNSTRIKLFDGSRGRVVSQVACQKRIGNDILVAIGVAAEDPQTHTIRYFMLFGRGGHPSDLLRKGAWTESGILVSRPSAKAYQSISVSFPEGDTIAMSLQSFLRGSDGKYLPLESDVYVHTCPVATDGAKMLDKLIWHYSGELKKSR